MAQDGRRHFRALHFQAPRGKSSAMHNEYEFASVAAEDRRGFPSMLAVMLGFTFFSASMWAGATLGKGLSAPKFLLAVLAGNALLGTAFATVAYNHFVPWLNLLNLMLPSIGAILILDHFVVGRGRKEDAAARSVNGAAVAAWACGFLAAKFLPGIAPLNTLLAASAAYLLLARKPKSS
jgi:purine-cytosine permease-like protein